VGSDITERKRMEEELRKRIEDLEKFYDMAVSRELKMKEMKNEIESLKAELSKYKKDEG
jgi:polyhydroxyalkanoate synthesis regulator phasin